MTVLRNLLAVVVMLLNIFLQINSLAEENSSFDSEVNNSAVHGLFP